MIGQSGSYEKLNFLVSLTTNDNDYKWNRQPIPKARLAGWCERANHLRRQRCHHAKPAIAKGQSNHIQIHHPDAIIFEPVGGLRCSGSRAAVAGAWDGCTEPGCRIYSRIAPGKSRSYFRCYLRSREIGRIQGRHLAHCCQGGSVLYIQGPSGVLAAKQRTTGMYETKPADVQVKIMRDNGPGTVLIVLSVPVCGCPRHASSIDLIAARMTPWRSVRRKAFRISPIPRRAIAGLVYPISGVTVCPKLVKLG